MSGHPCPAPRSAAEGERAVGLRLVERAQAGDLAAFGELYDRHADEVHRYVRARVASAQLAEDLTSETFVRALSRLSTFSWQGSDVGAWLVTIARNLVLDHHKSCRHRLEQPTDDLRAAAQPSSQDGPEEAVLGAMTADVLRAAVGLLGADQQVCIRLRFLQGLSVGETAARMGRTDAAVSALQYRALRSLGRLLPAGVEL